MKLSRTLVFYLNTTAVALIIGGLVVRYLLATPDTTKDDWLLTQYPLPTDPLNIALKWFLLALVALVAGLWVWFRSRNRQPAQEAEPDVSSSWKNGRVFGAIVLVGFWLVLICAIELSGPEWGFVAWSESRSDITSAMWEDRHYFIFESKGPGSDTMMIIRIVTQERHIQAFSLLASSGSPDAVEPLRERLRSKDTRKVLALLSWFTSVVLAGGFVIGLRRGVFA